MRRSSDSGDPGYAAFMAEVRQGVKHNVFLDGEEQKLVFTADDEQGFIVRAVPDSDGRFQIDPDDPGEVLMERVEGDVKIIMVPGGRQ